ncbi:MAG: tRNA (adenosine(37)-N6)-threonylcarbamoyltransferase complex ATPase subunit type 1 TsaE [Anaerovorax sp.]|nr:tRNA (adenosine(37)-N6)-threonylcarbamoyltransferase complex ATPase subunit type 1 TsaE [Anaerovorax sp.]
MKQATKWVMKNEEDTKKFGLALAKQLQSGSIVALVGDLGTGKTTLTKAIAEGLGVKEMITSPTFSIVHEYHDGRLPLYHFDVYRIGEIEEMYELGYEEYFYGEGICIVEWADLIWELMPEESVIIKIEYGESENERIYHVENSNIKEEQI